MKQFFIIPLLFAALLTGCGKRSAEERQAQTLEVYNVHGSIATATLTINGEEIFTTDVFVGENGIGKTIEGDRKTPICTLHITGAFGILPDPGTSMPYTMITPSIFACDEADGYYNQIIDTAVVHHQCKGEDMFNIRPHYNYGLFTDYNKECVYPRGSNIFVHCKGPDTYTAGCIALDEDKIREILIRCDTTLVVTVR